MSVFQPSFFDIFGLITFTFITAVSLWALLVKRSLPRWILIILLFIGVGGLIVDGSIVYMIYIR